MSCGIKSKALFSAFLLVLFLLPSLSYSEVTLTDDEYQILMSLIEKSKQELTEYRTELLTLQDQLMESQAILDRERRKLETLQTESAVLKQNYSLLWTSYEEQRKRLNLIWLDRVGFGLGGMAAGFGLNAAIEHFK